MNIKLWREAILSIFLFEGNIFKLIDSLIIVTIDQQYLKVLYDACNYDSKLYLGILVDAGDKKYAIPLTSAKEKHKGLKNIDNGRVLIYENVKPGSLSKNDIYP